MESPNSDSKKTGTVGENAKMDRDVCCLYQILVLVNGEVSGYFDGKKGLRQGNPESPLLFTMVMELLTAMLTDGWKSKGYIPHPRCQRIKSSHVNFADDVLFS